MAGGPVYEYRGAVINWNEKETVVSFKLEGFPHGPHGRWGGIGHLDAIVSLVDAWLDNARLPAPYTIKAGQGA